MKRINDIRELLSYVEKCALTLENNYQIAKGDEEIKCALAPLVKSCLENLRSVLDYSAKEIWESYNSNKKKVYFPYGKDEQGFRTSVGRNLKNLQTQNINVYNLIESIQPHKCNNSWLYDLCNETNQIKHDKLPKQKRINSKEAVTILGNNVNIKGDGRIVIKNCKFNGVPIGDKEPVEISNNVPISKIKQEISGLIPVSRKYDWVEFRFENSGLDILNLIHMALKSITNYIDELSKEL